MILLDEGRHITFGTGACKTLIEKNPDLESEVHSVFDAYRGNVVGLVEYQKAVPGLEVQKYQDQKVRHYRNRCREMGITPDQTLMVGDAPVEDSVTVREPGDPNG